MHRPHPIATNGTQLKLKTGPEIEAYLQTLDLRGLTKNPRDLIYPTDSLEPGDDNIYDPRKPRENEIPRLSDEVCSQIASAVIRRISEAFGKQQRIIESTVSRWNVGTVINTVFKNIIAALGEFLCDPNPPHRDDEIIDERRLLPKDFPDKEVQTGYVLRIAWEITEIIVPEDAIKTTAFLVARN